MSIHKSLVVKSQLLRSRNVWTRLERIMKLEADGKIESGRSIFGLPKVRTQWKVKATRRKPGKEGEGEATEATEAAT
jgi:small basic protein (TIGR04137 family)